MRGRPLAGQHLLARLSTEVYQFEPAVTFATPVTQTYAGSATLKPLLPYVEAIIRENQLEAITPGQFEAIKGSAAGAQRDPARRPARRPRPG